MNRHLAIKMSCFSVIAPRQSLLRCPNKLHPCNDALPYHRPSMDICVLELRNSPAHALMPALGRLESERFNHNLFEPDLIRGSLEEKWYEYRDNALSEFAKDWCDDNKVSLIQ